MGDVCNPDAPKSLCSTNCMKFKNFIGHVGVHCLNRGFTRLEDFHDNFEKRYQKLKVRKVLAEEHRDPEIAHTDDKEKLDFFRECG